MSKVKVLTCIECGKEFTLTPEHEEWFLDKGLKLPKRCSECRNKKRSQRGMKESGNPEAV